MLDLDDDMCDQEAMNGILDSTQQLKLSARRAKNSNGGVFHLMFISKVLTFTSLI